MGFSSKDYQPGDPEAPTIAITWRGRTETVQIVTEYYRDGELDVAWTAPVFLGRSRAGSKTHDLGARLFPMDAERAKKLGATKDTYRQDSLGRWLGIQLEGRVLNTRIYPVAWKDGRDRSSQHIGG